MITTYTETTTDLKVNKIDRETFDTLSAQQISPKELWFITSADSVVVDIDKIGQGGTDYGPEISELSANKRDYADLTVQKEMDMPPFYNIRSITVDFGVGKTVMDQFFINTGNKMTWYYGNSLSIRVETLNGEDFTLYWNDGEWTQTFTMEQLKQGYVFHQGTGSSNTYEITGQFGKGYRSFSLTFDGQGHYTTLNDFTVIEDADEYHNTWYVWYKGDLESDAFMIVQLFSPGSSATAGEWYVYYRRYNGVDTLIGMFTDTTKMTDQTHWDETWTYEWQGDTYTQTYHIDATRNWDSIALKSDLDVLSANVSTIEAGLSAYATMYDVSAYVDAAIGQALSTQL